MGRIPGLTFLGPACPPAARPDLRAFCGEAYPWQMISELADGCEVTACYLVHEKQRRETRSAKPFLQLTLGDRTGTITAMVWDDAERLDAVVVPEEVVGVRGRVTSYNDRLQLTVQWAEPLQVGDDDLAFFLPSCPRDREALSRELDRLINTVEDAPLRTLLQRCLGKRTTLGRTFRMHPAGKRNHHAYLGGLMEHSLSVALICDRLAAHYLGQGARIDRDLLVAGALLHDIGKVRELSASRSFGYTVEGHLLGHILLGIQIVTREAEAIPGLAPDRLLLVQHLIASHQGRLEWASPKVPQMLEALVLHYADDLDSKMNPAIALLAGAGAGEFTAYDRHLERALFNPAPAALARAREVEPVSPEEAAEVLIDLFRG
ncbi:MAG TPA: HD domain-containing protein [Longimicrobiaceae bacterium]|nr:HD domain-containing protein [Longimicrobiaceae bacterium]